MHLSTGNILVISFGCDDEMMLKECQNNLSWDSYRQFWAREGQFLASWKKQDYPLVTSRYFMETVNVLFDVFPLCLAFTTNQSRGHRLIEDIGFWMSLSGSGGSLHLEMGGPAIKVKPLPSGLTSLQLCVLHDQSKLFQQDCSGSSW